MHVARGEATALQMVGATPDVSPLGRRAAAINPALQGIRQNRALTTTFGVGVVGDLFGHCRGDTLTPQVVQEAGAAHRSAAKQLRRSAHTPGAIIDVAVLDAAPDGLVDLRLVVAPLEEPRAQRRLGEIAPTQQCESVGERLTGRPRGHTVPAGPNPSVPVAAFLACMEDTIPRSWRRRSFGLVAAAIATSSVMKPSPTRASNDWSNVCMP